MLTLAGCEETPPGTEDCHARLFIAAQKCGPSKPCDRLVVYWSGGEQTCRIGAYDELTKAYADEGFVAACAQPYTTTGEAGRYPYHRELERMTLLLSRLRGLAEVKASWSGKKLLVAGVSHGGTAPLVAIAAGRALRERTAEWTGSLLTAVLLYDGISNPAALDEWTAQQQSCSLPHSRYVGRYGDGQPLVHSCANKVCFCSDPPHKADWEKDTVVIV